MYLRKWIGLARMTTSAALYTNNGPLKLPIPSIVEIYKCGKVRTIMMLRYSNDEAIFYLSIYLSTTSQITNTYNYLHKHIPPYYINDTTLRAIQKEDIRSSHQISRLVVNR